MPKENTVGIDRKHFLQAIFVSLLIALLCVSCGSTEAENALVVYVPPAYPIRDVLSLACEIYQKRFPEVHLTVKTFGDTQYPWYTSDNYQNYRETLHTELTAGKGPDLVVFCGQDFPDIDKLLDAGNFYNLDERIRADSEFDFDNYQPFALDCGYHKGARLYIPLNYTQYSFLTTKQTLEAYGFEMTAQTTFEEWSEQIVSYIKTHSIQENRELFFGTLESYATIFLNSCGLELLNYETGEISVDTEDFRTYMDFYKAMYPCFMEDWDQTLPNLYPSIGSALQALKDNRLLFYMEYTYQELMADFQADIRRRSPDSEIVMLPLPVMEGVAPFATIDYRAAIRSSSPNKANAYEFIKILLSQTPQDDGHIYIPVNMVTQQLNGIVWKNYGFTQREADQMYQFVTTLPCREKIASAVTDILYETMMPWIRDEKSYEECLSELESTLALYIHE